MVTVPATVTTAAIQGITAAMAIRHITAATLPPIMEGTPPLPMHRCIPAIDTVGWFAQRSPTMPAQGITGIIGGTVGTGELRGSGSKIVPLPASRKRAAELLAVDVRFESERPNIGLNRRGC